ncbi:oligosaccharide flippase family protein [Comamonas testosteroni]|nr:oligosaccharide flippase family protein [Comamonas testosteroni]QQN71615.1 oligosaccharide flippase family protein [Comamonas testosteroni]
MSLRKNIIANYASQLYVTAVGIVMVPLYIRYMGAEAYGLVGFFAMLQAWFNLLDMGLTPTMARESARYQGGAITLLDYRQLARALEGVFAAIALLGGVLLFSLAPSIAGKWLNASQLPQQEITQALQLMAVIIALRWMCGLYRGVITGAERLVWLSGFNGLIATGRFVLILPVLMFVCASPQAFFGFQLGVALLEVAGLVWMAYRLLPSIPRGQRIQWKWAPLKPVLKFSLSIAFTSSVWVLVTQTDKLVLSKILPLADYGYFTVAVLVASGIMIVSSPISSALMPRMTRLQAEGQHDALIAIYRQATQLVTVTAIPAALALIFFAPQVLWAWTGDAALVQRAAPALSLYAIGYAFLAVGAFPYYLQYAKGNLHLHLIGNALFMLLLIPSIIWAASHYGMAGAGWAWLVSNAMYFLLWTPLVHRKFAPGIHFGWLLADIVRPAFLPLAAAMLAVQYMNWSDERITLMLELAAVSVVLLLLAYPLAGRINMHIKLSRKNAPY